VIVPLGQDTAPVTKAAICPTCGTAAHDAHERFQLRRDLAVLWLYADLEHLDGVRGQRHCRHCQPHQQLALLECADCGQGPLLVGDFADQASLGVLPEPIADRLTRAGWRTQPDLICADRTTRPALTT
jgi:hypothetical protein